METHRHSTYKFIGDAAMTSSPTSSANDRSSTSRDLLTSVTDDDDDDDDDDGVDTPSCYGDKSSCCTSVGDDWLSSSHDSVATSPASISVSSMPMELGSGGLVSRDSGSGLDDDVILRPRPPRSQSMDGGTMDSRRVKSTRTIQRQQTMATYQIVRDSAVERTLTLEKLGSEKTFGFHLLGSRPLVVSTVEPRSAASRAGMLIGDKVIAVNDTSLVDATVSKARNLIPTDVTRVQLTLVEGVLSRDTALCCGYISRLKTKKAWLKSWHRCWAKVKHDGFMYFFKSSQDKEPAGAICLSQHVLVKAPECHGAHEYAFKLVKYGTHIDTHYFSTSSEDDMMRWVSAINMVAAHTNNKMAGAWMDVSSHNVDVPALSVRNPECHGYLEKVGNRRRTWRRRYCVLKYACLYYYRESTSSTAKGVAHLQGYTVADDTTSRKFGFQLLPPRPSMRLYQFVADTETDFKRWKDALTTSIGRWVEVTSSC